jgi:hypothetical protein
MQLLSPAFTSEIVIQQIRFYQASIRPQKLALATLNYWLLMGKDDQERIGVNEENKNRPEPSRPSTQRLAPIAVRHNPIRPFALYRS